MLIVVLHHDQAAAGVEPNAARMLIVTAVYEYNIGGIRYTT